jgi:hypothetical protein
LSSQGYPPDQHVVNLSGIHDPEAKLLKLLNVRQVVAEGRVRSVDPGVPYAYLVHNVVEKPAEGILAYMKSDAYSPKDTVVFEKEDIARRPPETLHKEPLHASCTVTGYASDRIALKTRSSSAGYLVLSEVFYPGWTAVVDGRKGEVMRGNYLLRVIPLERGDHEVMLCFVSWPFRLGGLISLVTLVGAACLLWSLRKRRRETPDSKEFPLV